MTDKMEQLHNFVDFSVIIRVYPETCSFCFLQNYTKLRGFSRIDLPCIDICYNALPIQYLWFFKARGHTSGAPGSLKRHVHRA